MVYFLVTSEEFFGTYAGVFSTLEKARAHKEKIGREYNLEAIITEIEIDNC